MKKFLMSFVCVGMFVLVLPTQAQAVDTAAIIARMEAIITEMNALQAEFKTLASATTVPVAATTPTGSVLGAATTALQEEVVPGATNDTIAKVQRLLATDPLIYSYGVASGFFGPKTEEAIRAFQSRFGLDPVGVMGPATSNLVLEFFMAYPGEQYPADTLKSRPSAKTQDPAPTVAGVSTTVDSNPIASIDIEEDDDEFVTTIRMTNGGKKVVVVDSDDEDAIVAEILKRTNFTRVQVLARLDVDEIDYESKRRRSSDADEDDAEDAIEDAEKAIEEAEDEIDEADEDDKDVDESEDLLDEAEDLLDEAEEAFDDEDYDEAVEKAEEAIELAEEAEDAIGARTSGNEDVDEIEVRVTKGEARVDVTYDDGDDDRFTIDDDDREDIIAEIADELDLDEDEVEDLVAFDFGDIESILAQRENGKTRVTVEYESGVKEKLVMDEDEEDEIVDEIVKELDLKRSDVERALDMDF